MIISGSSAFAAPARASVSIRAPDHELVSAARSCARTTDGGVAARKSRPGSSRAPGPAAPGMRSRATPAVLDLGDEARRTPARAARARTEPLPRPHVPQMVADLLLATCRSGGLDHPHARSVRCYWTNVTVIVRCIRSRLTWRGAARTPNPRRGRHLSGFRRAGDSRILGAHRLLLDLSLRRCPRPHLSFRLPIVVHACTNHCERPRP